MRLKDDGSQDLDWQEQDSPKVRGLTPQEEDEEDRIGRKRILDRYRESQGHLLQRYSAKMQEERRR